VLFGMVWLFISRKSTPEPKKEPRLDKVSIWYEGNTRASDVYEDVASAFLINSNNLLRITHNDGSEVYVALNQRRFVKLNIHYKED
jgi:hypothetical protein